MSLKSIIVLCAILVQSIYGQCIPAGAYVDDYAASSYGYGAGVYGTYDYPGYDYPSYDYPGCYGVTAPTSGGGFIVTSFSPISPTGVSVLSENAIEGILTVVGELPFLACVALDGALPTVGAGGINYGCGNGNVAIISEGLGVAGPAYPAALGYGAGLAAPGIGYGPAGLVAPGIGYGPAVGGFGYGGLGYGPGFGCAY